MSIGNHKIFITCALVPFYKLLELLPPTREGARRMGLVTLDQMLRALTHSVENPPHGVRIFAAPEIRDARKSR